MDIIKQYKEYKKRLICGTSWSSDWVKKFIDFNYYINGYVLSVNDFSNLLIESNYSNTEEINNLFGRLSESRSSIKEKIVSYSILINFLNKEKVLFDKYIGVLYNSAYLIFNYNSKDYKLPVFKIIENDFVVIRDNFELEMLK